jgi:similar to stage IV sporulation protein
MFLSQWWSYLLGYLQIVVRGENVERFINMALSRGIFLWDVTRLDETMLLMKVRISGFRSLRHIARRVRCRVYIQGKFGLPFVLHRLGRRWMLVFGALVFAATLYTLSSFIWFVEVTGNDKIEPEQVLQSAAKYGLKVGAYKWPLDKSAVERGIADDLRELIFVGVEIHGTKATIEVAEKILPGDRDEANLSAHLVAAKDGVVTEVLVVSGIAQVKKGDTVRKGQILISGIVGAGDVLQEDQAAEGTEKPRAPGDSILVRARGAVRARVWYEGYGEASLESVEEKLTADRVSSVGFRAGNKRIIVSGPRETPFQFYRKDVDIRKLPEWRNIKLPVELFTITYTRIEHSQRSLGYDEAAYLAGRQALAQAQAGLPSEAKVMSRRLERVDAGPGVIRMKMTIETVEDIARTLPIK